MAFIAEQVSVEPERLRASTRLLHDLGMDGDDASEFLQAFAQRLGVDLSRFEFSRHFGPEGGCNPFAPLHGLVFGRKQLKMVPITIADLVEAAQQNKLVVAEASAIESRSQPPLQNL